MAFNEELAIRQLIAMYRAGFQDIIEILIDKDARRLSTRHQRALLGNVHQILFAMDTEADLWIQDVVGKVYSSTTSDIIITLVDMGYPKPTDSFSRVHQRAVDVIAQNMSGNLKNATQYVGRRVDDIFRQVGLEQTGKKLVTGASWQEMKSNLVEDMLSKGQTGFVDKLGREWRLDSYAEMVARTTTREAASTATINQCMESGCDLVQVSTHYPTCHLCVPIQGKVYSLSGTDKRYPKYGDEVNIPVHPNCRHVLTPYNRELDSNSEETQKHSNTSLTEDTRTDQEKEAYKDTQDSARIASNKRKAREVLYTPSAPLKEKVNAASKLAKVYERTGTKPRGKDAVFVRQHEEYLKTKRFDGKMVYRGSYEPRYLEKLEELNDTLTKRGHLLSEHAMNRVTGRIAQGRIPNVDVVIELLDSPVKYVQEDGNLVKYLNGFSAHIDVRTDVVLSITPRKKPKEDWRPKDE